jgi:hypothetical protein
MCIEVPATFRPMWYISPFACVDVQLPLQLQPGCGYAFGGGSKLHKLNSRCLVAPTPGCFRRKGHRRPRFSFDQTGHVTVVYGGPFLPSNFHWAALKCQAAIAARIIRNGLEEFGVSCFWVDIPEVRGCRCCRRGRSRQAARQHVSPAGQ